MKKELILVNKDDQVLGYGEKIPTHKAGRLHRAFSLFVYCKNEGKFLLQKRSIQKYHSGGKWSNACCSHPYKNETWFEALQRGVADELKLTLMIDKDVKCDSNLPPQLIDEKMFFAGSFIYFSDYLDLIEHECDYVFVYTIDSIIPQIMFNTSEVSEMLWLTTDEIEAWVNKSPDEFSSWFGRAFELVKETFLTI